MLFELTAPHAQAKLLRRSPRIRSSRIALRRRLHISPLITDTGTVETEWSTAWTDPESFTMPTTVKWTPEGSTLVWGRTEYSANFDVVSSLVSDGNRVTHASDHAGITATTLIADGEHWNFAVAPAVTFGSRDQPGVRAGLTGITRYDQGRNSAGATITWTGTPKPNDSSPAGTWDLGLGFGHTFGDKTTVHMDAQLERATGFESAWSFFEGVEYQFTPALALDATMQHLNATGGTLDRQILIGLTFNLGRPAAWFKRSASQESSTKLPSRLARYSAGLLF
jgi:hypothetical protein